MATPRFLRSFAWVGAITLSLVLSCYGQTVKPNEVVKWDDYTFKFGPSAQVAQVLPRDEVVGSILMTNVSLQVIPLPDADGERLKKSFEDWQAFSARSHSGGSPAGGPPNRHALPTMCRTFGWRCVETNDGGRVRGQGSRSVDEGRSQESVESKRGTHADCHVTKMRPQLSR